MPFHELKRALAERVVRQYANRRPAAPFPAASEIIAEFGSPPSLAVGHLSFPCFKLGKALDRPTDEVAREIAESFNAQGDDGIVAAAVGPYVNFRWKPAALYARVFGRLFQEGAKYGSETFGEKPRVALEYGSPNLGRRMGVADLRGAVLGNVLGNVYEFLGYRTERINFVGDWGLPMAKLLTAFEMWGDRSLLEGKSGALSDEGAMDHLVDLYLRYQKLLDDHPEHESRASQVLQRLEHEDPQVTSLWKAIRDVSLKSMERTLARLNVKFHHVEAESQYVASIAATLDDVRKKRARGSAKALGSSTSKAFRLLRSCRNATERRCI